MEIKKHWITLQGCFLIWIGISVVLSEVTTEAISNTTDNSTIMMTTETILNSSPDTTAAVSPVAYTEDPFSSDNNSLTPDDHSEPPKPPPKTCHLYTCTGDSCYKNQSMFLYSANITCPSYCEMYRHNSSFYENRCNDHCMHHMCNSTEQNGCALHCCNQSQCFNSEDIMNGGNMTMDNKTAISQVTSSTTTKTTTTTTTTTTTIQYSDKKCRSFTCTGADCYKTQTATATKQCQVGKLHCELQKKVTGASVSFEGGCSNTCATSTKSCATITTGDCFQECCNATNTGCCMKLDGQVHFNTGAQIHKASALRLFTCAFIVIFLSHYFSSSRV